MVTFKVLSSFLIVCSFPTMYSMVYLSLSAFTAQFRSNDSYLFLLLEISRLLSFQVLLGQHSLHYFLLKPLNLFSNLNFLIFMFISVVHMYRFLDITFFNFLILSSAVPNLSYVLMFHFMTFYFQDFSLANSSYFILACFAS